MSNSCARVSVFNCEWRISSSADAAVIRQRLFASTPDIICLTEAYRDFFAGDGHLIEATPDYGYPIVNGRRKVMLWSRMPWTRSDVIGSVDLPPGRFVAGRTMTPIGDVDVIGVCIPWASAHVRSGNCNRQRWEDHLAYLAALDANLPSTPHRTLVLGDFNQRVPRKFQPGFAFEALSATLLSRMKIATAGFIEPIGKQAIDHICHSYDLVCADVSGLTNVGPNGRMVSDHFGLSASIRNI